MIPSPSYQKIQEIIRKRFIRVSWNEKETDLYKFLEDFPWDFKGGHIEKIQDKTMVIGILFAHPNQKIAKNFFHPYYDYLDIRSDDEMDFFWVGYEDGWNFQKVDESSEHAFRYRRRRLHYIDFNDEAFESFKKQIEQRTSWEYSGGSELILCPARWLDYNDKDVHLDFSKSVVIQLDELFSNESEFSRYLEQIFKINKHGFNLSFAKDVGIRVAGQIFIDWLISLLPQKAGHDIKKLKKHSFKNLDK